MVSSSARVQLVIKTLAVQIIRISVVNPMMIKKLPIVTAKIQTMITQPKTIVMPSIVVNSVGNWVSVVVNCLAEMLFIVIVAKIKTVMIQPIPITVEVALVANRGAKPNTVMI